MSIDAAAREFGEWLSDRLPAEMIMPTRETAVRDAMEAFAVILRKHRLIEAPAEPVTREVDQLKDLLRRADVYVVAHIVAAKGALEGQQEARDEYGGDEELRELIDDINEAQAVLNEMRAAITPERPAACGGEGA